MIVGMLGGGQLSLMLAEAAKPLGIDVVFIDPAPDACANRVARQISLIVEGAIVTAHTMNDLSGVPLAKETVRQLLETYQQ